MTDRARPALAALIILQGVMLGALFAGIAPHPPAATPLFGMAPFLAAAISAAAAALVLGSGSRAGRGLAALAALAGLVSFGPQKFLDPQFPLIWPAVLAGQVAAVAVLAACLPRRAARTGGRAHVG